MSDLSLSRRSLLRAAGVAGPALLAAPALAGCGTSSAAPLRPRRAQVSLRTHDPDHTKTFRTAIKDGNTPDLAGLNVDQFPRVMQSSIAENLFVDLTDAVRPATRALWCRLERPSIS